MSELKRELAPIEVILHHKINSPLAALTLRASGNRQVTVLSLVDTYRSDPTVNMLKNLIGG